MENEELRERLGMDPKEKLDIEDVRHKKKVKAEQAIALNRALNKEVNMSSIILHYEIQRVVQDIAMMRFLLYYDDIISLTD